MKTTRILGVLSLFLLLAFSFSGVAIFAQSGSGSVNGNVTDATSAVVPGATVTIENGVSGYTRTTTTDASGQFHFYNVPLNPYRVTVSLSGFQATAKSVEVSSTVPLALPVTLQVASSTTTVTVEAPVDLIERDAVFHTDIDRTEIDRLPLESPSSELSSIVTLSSPGVAADSNGLMHGLGDHAENSFNVDGQPITDQQSKVFSNQLPAAAVQSLEVIDGAPPAEYGDKTSLVVKVTTRSGQGVTKPTGSVTLSYGSFGSSNVAMDTAYGGENWGNFIAVNGLNSGRFLDGPEFSVFHDRGNEENFFDRVDFQLGAKDSIHVNMQYTRSWFQTPNDFENIGVLDQNGNPVGNTDQRSKIGTLDIAPSYTHVINSETVANFGAYIRRDGYNYYPSNNLFADFAPDQQQETVAQFRTLTNMGLHGDVSYVHGATNAKFGAMYSQTLLRENDRIGLTDPGVNAPCLDVNNNPVNGLTSVNDCVPNGFVPNDGNNYNSENPNASGLPTAPFNPVLLPYDLTRGGSVYAWFGGTDVKQLALYAEDQITAGNWLFNLGVRGDLYNGLTIQRQIEPRVGVSYNVKKTGTVMRLSYARTQETPFNENLVLSSTGCANPVLFGIFATLSDGSCDAEAVTPFNPGSRNEFHAGVQQAIGRHVVFNGEYIWKYTHNAYDFSVLGTTPITFPIEWHNSKIPGYAISLTLTDYKGLSARFNASSVAARFFNPQLGGVGSTPGVAGSDLPFRIDHDQKFNQTTHAQYNMPFRKSLWYGFNWRYDSGLVAGAAPCYNPNGANTDCDPSTATTINGAPGILLSGLSADQQFQAGLVCNGIAATPTRQIMVDGVSQCTVAGLTSKLINLSAINSEDADKNPSRIAPRNLFDMALGDENIVHFGAAEHYKIGARFTAINVLNKYALYNFLSTFSGTHYVTPRTITGQISFNF